MKIHCEFEPAGLTLLKNTLHAGFILLPTYMTSYIHQVKRTFHDENRYTHEICWRLMSKTNTNKAFNSY